jgi:hypothetical protein
MPFLFYRISTWLIIELVATSILVALNMFIPALMAFTSYRNMVNFYFSSAALSSSLLNCLYIYYLVQQLRSKGLSENNCRAIYYLQTSCTVVLGTLFLFLETIKYIHNRKIYLFVKRKNKMS